MRKLPTILSILLLFCFATTLNAQITSCGSTTRNFSASLLGGNIAGAQNGFGNVALTFDSGNATVRSSTLGLNNITGITLFRGNPASGGTAVMTFTDFANNFQAGNFSRTLPVDQTLAADISANPQNFFFVITTTDFPQGAVSGPLATSNLNLFSGTLRGSNVTNGGSPTGAGAFTFSLTPVNSTTMRLNFDVQPTGIGSQFNSLVLNMNGGAPITLATDTTTTNGHITGSTLISTNTAQSIVCNPGAFSLIIATPAFQNGAIAGPLAVTNEIFIPVVGSVHGLNNTNFMTDLNIFNNSPIGSTASGSNADVFIQFFPQGNIGSTASIVSQLTITPRGTSTTRDISSTMFSGQINGIGALRIVSAGSVFANARIYNNQIGAGLGTFGQSVPGLRRSEALMQGALVGLMNTSNGTGTTAQSARTNVGFFNPNDNPTSVALELRDDNGTVLGNQIVVLAPFQQAQLSLIGASGLFPNVSGDGSFVLPSKTD